MTNILLLIAAIGLLGDAILTEIMSRRLKRSIRQFEGFAADMIRLHGTFEISADGKAIFCRRCFRVSWHPEDVAQRYCGYCHSFHEDQTMTPEFFVIRTRGRQYVGPLGFTPDIDKAVFFPSRWAALGKCNELGAQLDGAAIVPYSPALTPQGPPTPTDPQKSPRRARGAKKASNGPL